MEEVRTASDVAAHTGRTKTGVEWAAGKEQIREAKASLFQSDFHMVLGSNASREAGLLSVGG